jgi:hypothetical protein
MILDLSNAGAVSLSMVSPLSRLEGGLLGRCQKSPSPASDGNTGTAQECAGAIARMVGLHRRRPYSRSGRRSLEGRPERMPATCMIVRGVRPIGLAGRDAGPTQDAAAAPPRLARQNPATALTTHTSAIGLPGGFRSRSQARSADRSCRRCQKGDNGQRDSFA